MGDPPHPARSDRLLGPYKIGNCSSPARGREPDRAPAEGGRGPGQGFHSQQAPCRPVACGWGPHELCWGGGGEGSEWEPVVSGPCPRAVIPAGSWVDAFLPVASSSPSVNGNFLSVLS